MRYFLTLFPVDRRDIARHAATICGHFATARQRAHAAFVALTIVTFAADGIALAVMIGGAK